MSETQNRKCIYCADRDPVFGGLPTKFKPNFFIIPQRDPKTGEFRFGRVVEVWKEIVDLKPVGKNNDKVDPQYLNIGAEIYRAPVKYWVLSEIKPAQWLTRD